DSVGGAWTDPAAESLDVRHDDVVANHLAAVADALRELCKGPEILLVERIFHAEERKVTREPLHEVDLLLRRETAVAIPVLPAAVELRRREIQGGSHRESGFAFDLPANIGEERERFLVLELRDPCALVATAEGDARQSLHERVADEGVDAGIRHDVGKGGRSLGNDEVF